MNEAKERAKKVKLFAHDIHGVLTTNTVFCDVEGNRRYAFWHMDGFGDLSLMANDIKPVFLDTTSIDGEGLFRAKELKLDKMYFAVTDKVAKLEELKKELNLTDEQIGYIGCELTDIPAMKKGRFCRRCRRRHRRGERTGALHNERAWRQGSYKGDL